MKFVYVLISIFAICNGDMMCMLRKYSECYELGATAEASNAYCAKAQQKVDCWKREAKECGVEEDEKFRDLLVHYNEICKEGLPPHEGMNESLSTVFKRHEECLFNVTHQARIEGPCFQIMEEAMDYALENETMIASCTHVDQVNDCIEDEVEKACGKEAVYLNCKVFGPLQKLESKACVEIGAIGDFGAEKMCLLKAEDHAADKGSIKKTDDRADDAVSIVTELGKADATTSITTVKNVAHAMGCGLKYGLLQIATAVVLLQIVDCVINA